MQIKDVDFKIVVEKEKKQLPIENRDQVTIAQSVIKFVLEGDYDRMYVSLI